MLRNSPSYPFPTLAQLRQHQGLSLNKIRPEKPEKTATSFP